MPCFFVAFALFMPRLVIAALFVLSNWFKGISALWGILGFIFLPTSLLWYTAVQHWWGGVWSFWPIVGIVIALMIDLSPASHRRRRRRIDEE
jgi:hypothetical protein